MDQQKIELTTKALIQFMRAKDKAALLEPPPLPSGVHVKKGIAYVEDGNERHRMDLYTPGHPDSLPILVFFHGGGWVCGNKERFAPYLAELCSKGFFVASCNYRLSDEMPHPAQVQDALAALAYVARRGQEWGGNPRHLFIVGDSAGAHLTALLAAIYSTPALQTRYQIDGGQIQRLTGIGLLCGIYDIETANTTKFPAIQGFVQRLLGQKELSEVADELSPLRHLNSDFPPMFITSTKLDPLYSETETLIAEAQKQKIPYKLLLFDEHHTLGHDYQMDLAQPEARECLESLTEYFRSLICQEEGEMESYRLNCSQKYSEEELRYLNLLAMNYPSIQTASNEIINLKAILNLPKGTEHFLSDIHGEYEAFLHMLRNASGVIKTKVDEAFATTLSQEDRQMLATLIYYPKEKLEIIKKQVANLNDWYRITLYRLVEICRNISSKYTRSKVRRALPKEFEFIIDELIHGYDHMPSQNEYYQQIIDTIIEIDRADAFITALSQLIQRLAIDHLHIIGDVYDRGPGAHIILDELMKYHSVDIQWGNHDILWMGAAAGNAASIANVIRICARYNNLDTLEDGYGISLRPLALFAQEIYKEDSCEKFFPEILGEKHSSESDLRSIARIHKAITIIQLKLEGQIMRRRDDFQMKDRSFLENMNLADGMVTVEGRAYPLVDTYFPTWDAQSPLILSAEEQEVVDRLVVSFSNNERLQNHVRFLFSKGSMYTAYNSNLLYHGCIPMDQNGEFSTVTLNGRALKGKALLDSLEQTARQGYFAKPGSIQKQNGLDTLWYLWCGAKSPLFGKSKMTTFERYFLNEPDLNEEGKDPYYKLVDDEETCRHILGEFGLDPETSHIINGHVPVKVKKGESPIKGGGKLLIIDGGLSKAYHKQTGIAGYTLIYNSQGMSLSAHEPFESTAKAIEEEKDIHSKTIVLERRYDRQMVKDTDNGRILKERIRDLERLLWAYRLGLIKEQS